MYKNNTKESQGKKVVDGGASLHSEKLPSLTKYMLSFKNSDTVSRSKAGSKSVITFKNSISLSSRGNKSRSTESVTWNLQLSPAERPVRGRSKSQNWDAQLLLPPLLAPWDSQANTAACSHGEELEGPRPPLRQHTGFPSQEIPTCFIASQQRATVSCSLILGRGERCLILRAQGILIALGLDSAAASVTCFKA